MNNDVVLSFITQAVSAVMLNLLCLLFYKNIYGKKFDKKYIYILAFAVSFISMIAINRLENQYINILYSYFSVNLICVLLFKTTIKAMWLNNTLLWFFIVCCNAVIPLSEALIESHIFYWAEDYMLAFAGCAANILLTYAAYRALLNIMQKFDIKAIRWKLALFTAVIILFEVLNITSLAMEINSISDGIRVIVTIAGFILITVFLSYIISEVSRAYQYKYELSLSEQLQEVQLANYKEIEQKYRESRTIIHDIKKHLMVLENLRGTESPKADEYSSLIYSQMDKLFCGFHCSNQILGIIFSQKISKAKSEGIKVMTSVEDIRFDFMDDLDITAIFANLWDNAIEACRKVEEERYIKVKVNSYNDFISISFVNSCSGGLIPKGNYFLSTKKNHDGIGISSIKMSVEKYDGVFTTDFSDNSFKAEITIPIPDSDNIIL